MKILQLCFINNYWRADDYVESIDIKTGSNVLDLPNDYGKSFDLVIASPPCDQFTKANTLNWIEYPDYFISVAKKCFEICISSGNPWIYENPPGRIETFVPGLKQFRIATWHGSVTNKEYIVYSNQLIIFSPVKRYGKPGSVNNFSKRKREAWQKDFFEAIQSIRKTEKEFPASKFPVRSSCL